MLTLDRLDKRILHELDLNARQPYSSIARRVRLGNDLVEYRIQKFVAEGLIQRFTPMFEPSALGVGIYKTYLKHRMSKALLARFIKELSAHPMLYWLCEGHGTWDALFSLAARGAIEFQAAQDKVLAKYGEYILDMEVCTPFEVVRFPKHYLIGSGSKTNRWRRTRAKEEIDGIERRILEALSTNCRKPTAQIAKEVGATPAIVGYRLQKMEETGVILGYRTQLDYRLLGMMVFKVFVELKRYDPRFRNEILQYAKEEPHITCFVQQLGREQIEVEFEVSDYYHFSGLLDAFQAKFGEHLGRLQYMLIKQDYFHRIPTTS